MNIPTGPFPTTERLRVALIEDDEAFRASMKRSLEIAGYSAPAFASAEEFLESDEIERVSIVLTDLKLTKADGLYVLDRVRRADADLPVVLMTGHGDIPTAIQAIRAGAYDFLEKPFDREKLLAVIQRGCEQFRLVKENRRLKSQLAESSGIDQRLTGDSPALRELRDLVLRIAPTPADVLIVGETGTGKERVARCLHDYGRPGGNFVAVNCAAVPEHLFESELFGHEAGAFTGASKQRIGKIEHAKNGTLLLDEIEAMPLALQAKVLRVLQEREIERLGSNRPIPVAFRVVAASKLNLAEHSEKGLFRADLYYRLNVVSLRVPPLRERHGDILVLFRLFVQEACERFQMSEPQLTQEQNGALLTARWPGNVRELKACADRLVLGLPIFVDGESAADAPRSFDESIAVIERALLEESLRRNGGSVKASCAELSLTPATLYRKLKALSVDPSVYKA
jgi:DNA-binding NtrC family response regulator